MPTPAASPSVDTEALVVDCVDGGESAFVGASNGLLTIHYDLVRVGPSKSPYWSVYLPVTDASPELAARDAAMICNFDPTGAVEPVYGATTPLTEAEVDELFAGTGDWWAEPGH